MRSVKVVSFIALAAMLGTVVLTAAPVGACSLASSPTRCVTDIYNAQKAQVTAKTGSASAYVSVLPGAALACPDAHLGITPPGVPGAPGAEPIQQYGANLSGNATNPSVSAPLAIFASLGNTLNQAYFGAVAVALHYDNQVTNIVLPFIPDTSNLQHLNMTIPPTLPTLPDPAAGVNGATSYVNGEAGNAQAEANQTMVCISHLPQP